ncbi:hypothetical protein Tco_0447872 [Tanacetum coccineum]
MTDKESKSENMWNLYTDGASSSDGSGAAKEVLVEVLHEKSIVQREVADIINEEGENWMLPIREYLLLGILPRDPTTPKSSNRETPFSLVYGSEAVVLIEISVETKRIKEFEVRQNEKRRREDLDILEERMEIASIREAHYKQKLEEYYNKRVRLSTFKPGTYVLPLDSASKAKLHEKIRPT